MIRPVAVVVCWECGAFFDGAAAPAVWRPGEGLRRMCPRCFTREFGKVRPKVWGKRKGFLQTGVSV